MSLIVPARSVSEVQVQALRERCAEARKAYDFHVSNEHVWYGMDTYYEYKRAQLWSAWIEARYAVRNASDPRCADA